MPAHPKSSAKHKRDGGYRKDRHGNRMDAQMPAGKMPVKPKGLTVPQHHLWDTICNELPPGIVGAMDTASLTELMRIYRLMTEAGAALEGDATAREPRLAYSNYLDRWLKLCNEFGLTPAARTRIKVPEGYDKKEEDPFSGGMMAG